MLHVLLIEVQFYLAQIDKLNIDQDQKIEYKSILEDMQGSIESIFTIGKMKADEAAVKQLEFENSLNYVLKI